MMFERLFKWMTREVSNRSGLIATPTALLVDGSRPTEAPPPMRLPEWEKHNGPGRLPPKAVAFLSPDPKDRDTHVFIINVEKQTIETMLELEPGELGRFASLFLASTHPNNLRTLLNAPAWFRDPQWSHSVPIRRAQLVKTVAMSTRGDVSPTGVIPEEKQPPQPPRLQALIALADETAGLQELPVVVTAEA